MCNIIDAPSIISSPSASNYSTLQFLYFVNKPLTGFQPIWPAIILIPMSNRRIQQLVVLGAIVIATTVILQTFWVFNTWQFNASQLDRQVTLALRRVAQDLADVNGSQLSNQGLILKKTSNYYVVNTRDIIEPSVLEFFLRKHMDSVALRLDYEYAIFDCASDEMTFGKYVRYNQLEPSPLLETLPKEQGLNYYFGIQFPTMSQHLVHRMGFSLGLSAVSLLSLFFFAFSLYIILKQKRLSELQKDFINNMTHEFKTPISTIRIASEVLARSPIVGQDNRLKTYAQIIQEQNQRLNNQVGRVLQLAQLERSSFILNSKLIDLNQLVTQVAESMEIRTRENGGLLSLDCPKEEVWIQADPFHTRNVIHNLLDNAFKYAQPHPKVRLELTPHSEAIQLIISDNGPGIPSEFKDKVWEKFFRVPSGNLHNVKGFGLGLYYVNMICQKQRWSLALECPVDGGTTVRIGIPRTKKEIQ